MYYCYCSGQIKTAAAPSLPAPPSSATHQQACLCICCCLFAPPAPDHACPAAAMETSSSQKCPRVSYLHSSVGFPYGVHRSTDIRAAAEPCLRGHPADMESQSSASPLPVNSNQAAAYFRRSERRIHLSRNITGSNCMQSSSPNVLLIRAGPQRRTTTEGGALCRPCRPSPLPGSHQDASQWKLAKP